MPSASVPGRTWTRGCWWGALGIVLVSALWWLYFDVAAIVVRRRLLESSGVERARLARDSYGYLHLPMVAGIVLLAFGIETTLHHVDDALDTVPAVALCGGTALYLLGHIAFLFRTTRYIFRRRTMGAAVLLALIPVAVAVPALAALALVSAVCVLVVAYEAIRYRADRSTTLQPAWQCRSTLPSPGVTDRLGVLSSWAGHRPLPLRTA